MPDTELDEDLELDIETENADEKDAVDTPDEGNGAQDDAEEELIFESDAPKAREDVAENDRSGIPLPKRLRKEISERNKELAKARQRISELEKAAIPQKEQDFGPEPNNADDDVKFDEAKFKAKWGAWHQRKIALQQKEDAEKKARVDQQAELDRQWAAKQQSYAEQKAKVSAKVSDFADAEDEVVLSFTPAQMAMVQAYAERPAAVVYTLGKNKSDLQRLAAINDPVKFLVELVRMEERKRSMGAKPETRVGPERTVRSDSAGARSFDAVLEKMEKDWEKHGGSRKPIIDYKRKLQEKAAQRR